MTSTNSSQWPFKRLTESELRLKMEKVIYFKCGDKYTPGCRCKRKELQGIVLHNGETEGNREELAREEC